MPYSQSQVYQAEKRIGLSRKVGSSTSKLAYLAINVMKRQMYWAEAPPLGVHGVDVVCMIDIDEAQFKLESQDPRYGKVVKELRCNTTGMYKKGAGSVSLLLAISGDDDAPFEFHRTYAEGGTNFDRFFLYMIELLEFLEEERPGVSFIFTMDNLNIHTDPMIRGIIEDAGHSLVFRAPYWSCDGSIEYVFNTLHTELEKAADNGVSHVEDLRLKISDILHQMTPDSFQNYFLHVGFGDLDDEDESDDDDDDDDDEDEPSDNDMTTDSDSSDGSDTDITTTDDDDSDGSDVDDTTDDDVDDMTMSEDEMEE